MAAATLRTPGHSRLDTFTPAARTATTARAEVFPQASAEVESAIRWAAARVGVDASYMMAIAAQESRFRAGVKAPTSTATGLYQFIEQTWFEQVKQHGAKHGLGEYASQLVRRGKELTISDPAARQRLLELRKDPEYNALMGAEFARSNQKALESELGRKVTNSELYMAHFLGWKGAAKLLGERGAGRGDAIAATELGEKAAKANRNIFYEKGGRARSLDEVFDLLKKKIDPKVTEYKQPKGEYSYGGAGGASGAGGYTPTGSSFGLGPHGTPRGAFSGAGWMNVSTYTPPTPVAGGRFGFGAHGLPSYGGYGYGSSFRIGGSGLTSFGLNGFNTNYSGLDRNGIGTIGAAPSFGGGVGSIGIRGLGAFGLNSFNIHGGVGQGPTYGRAGGWEFGVGFTSFGSTGLRGIGSSGLSSFGLSGFTRNYTGLNSNSIGSIGSSGLSSFGVGGFSSSSGGGSSGIGGIGGSGMSSFGLSGFSSSSGGGGGYGGSAGGSGYGGGK